jgi:hypothetical protein
VATGGAVPRGDSVADIGDATDDWSRVEFGSEVPLGSIRKEA